SAHNMKKTNQNPLTRPNSLEITPLECAVTKTRFCKSFRMRSYKKSQGGRGTPFRFSNFNFRVSNFEDGRRLQSYRRSRSACPELRTLNGKRTTVNGKRSTLPGLTGLAAGFDAGDAFGPVLLELFVA